MRKYLLFTFLFLVTACAGVPATVPKSLQADAAMKWGLVFGSIANGEGIHYSVFGLRYRAIGSKEEGEFRYSHNWMRIANTNMDFQRDDAEGSVFSAHLPPGNYELFNVRFFENRGRMGTTTFTSKADFSVPFSVAEGKATYLGEYVGQRVTGNNIFQIPVSAGGYYVVSDQMERDIAILEKRGETVPREALQNVVAKVIEANVPLLRKEVMPEKQ